ncbi:MAG: hypothetical protein AAGB32_00930 [Pseudomonadota bacterium]
MGKDFVIVVEDRTVGGFQVRGFQYGKSFLTASGCAHQIEQSQIRGENVNPAFVAGLEAIRRVSATRRKLNPVYVSTWMNRLKLPFDESLITDEPGHFGFVTGGGKLTGALKRPDSDDVKVPAVDVFRVTL